MKETEKRPAWMWLARLLLAGVAATLMSSCGGGEDGGTDSVAEDGRWRKRREVTLSEDQQAQIQELRSMGYLGGYEGAPTATGVTRHDPEQSYEGLNFYTSGHAPVAMLMDMRGRMVHGWKRSFASAFPDRDADEKARPQAHHWRRAYPYPNGDLLVIFGGLGMMRIDRDSQVIWTTDDLVHHAAEILPNGDIYALTREIGIVPRVNEDEPIAEDFVVHYDSAGNVIDKWSVLEAFERSDYASLWDEPAPRRGDVFHVNSIDVLPEDFELERGRRSGGRRVLLSLRNLHVIGIMDLDAGTFVWATTGDFAGQHDARLLPGGRVLLFDNYGTPESSSVLELDLRGDTTPAWVYRGTDDAPFYSELCGAAQRLPGGTTLITESDGGRAFEVTPDGEIVWEFFNPELAGEQQEFIATLFEVARVPADFFEPAFSPEPTEDGGP